MFRGANKVTLDAKGRMALPTRYRERLVERCQGHVVVTVDRDECLLLYPLPDWEEFERKLMGLPTLNPQARRLHALALTRKRVGRKLLELNMEFNVKRGLDPQIRIGDTLRFRYDYLYDRTMLELGFNF